MRGVECTVGAFDELVDRRLGAIICRENGKQGCTLTVGVTRVLDAVIAALIAGVILLPTSSFAPVTQSRDTSLVLRICTTGVSTSSRASPTFHLLIRLISFSKSFLCSPKLILYLTIQTSAPKSSQLLQVRHRELLFASSIQNSPHCLASSPLATSTISCRIEISIGTR